MARCIKRSVIVEAHHMTADQFESRVDWPMYLHEAWDKKEGEVGRFFQIADGTYWVHTRERLCRVEENDYIILENNAHVFVFREDIFRKEYAIL